MASRVGKYRVYGTETGAIVDCRTLKEAKGHVEDTILNYNDLGIRDEIYVVDTESFDPIPGTTRKTKGYGE